MTHLGGVFLFQFNIEGHKFVGEIVLICGSSSEGWWAFKQISFLFLGAIVR